MDKKSKKSKNFRQLVNKNFSSKEIKAEISYDSCLTNKEPSIEEKGKLSQT